MDFVLECLVKAMFHHSTEHLNTNDLRPVTETFLEVAKKAPVLAAERLALLLQVTEPWVNMAMVVKHPSDVGKDKQKNTWDNNSCFVLFNFG